MDIQYAIKAFQLSIDRAEFVLLQYWHLVTPPNLTPRQKWLGGGRL